MDTKTKHKYEKAKYTVKKLEKEFKSITSTTPSKADIKSAPSKIRDAYRTYWKLKTSVLESTLSDILIDENAKDCFNSSNETADSSFSKPPDAPVSEDSVCFQPLCETTLTQSFSTESQSHSKLLDSFIVDSPNCSIQSDNHSEPLNFKNVINQDVHIGDKVKPKIIDKENVDKNSRVWGEHLNKDKAPPPPPPSQRKLETKSLSMQYAQKLFNPAKFKNFNKKNPRKPRVFQKAKTSDSLPPLVKSRNSIFRNSSFSVARKGVLSRYLFQVRRIFPLWSLRSQKSRILPTRTMLRSIC
uniref:Adenylosuccinate synthetase n=1 Tax=Lygus hesperus TaxID=30085 RepID=A0A0A9XPG7_LYGHE